MVNVIQDHENLCPLYDDSRENSYYHVFLHSQHTCSLWFCIASMWNLFMACLFGINTLFEYWCHFHPSVQKQEIWRMAFLVFVWSI